MSEQEQTRADAAEARVKALEAVLEELVQQSKYFTTEEGDCWFCDEFVDRIPHEPSCIIARARALLEVTP